MRVIGTICARGGSKGLKDKNIRKIAGKPLIGFTIDFLKKWGKANRIVCSTDSEKIASIAKKFGAEIPIFRPIKLATDKASKINVIKHIVKYCEDQEDNKYDIIVDLDPTAPLRKLRYLNEAFKKFITSDADNLYSVNQARKNPYFNMVELNNKGYAQLCKKSNVVRRQDAEKVYEINASIYLYKRDFLLKTNTLHSDKTIIYEMPVISSCDIDSELDFLFVEYLINNRVFKFD
jgi:N-acylneuraminate cytidylyltransferase/CMP-N,N'-diacetyllegionaminic acid synthase